MARAPTSVGLLLRRNNRPSRGTLRDNSIVLVDSGVMAGTNEWALLWFNEADEWVFVDVNDVDVHISFTERRFPSR
jgi:hypothetical protein